MPVCLHTVCDGTCCILLPCRQGIVTSTTRSTSWGPSHPLVCLKKMAVMREVTQMPPLRALPLAHHAHHGMAKVSRHMAPVKCAVCSMHKDGRQAGPINTACAPYDIKTPSPLCFECQVCCQPRGVLGVQHSCANLPVGCVVQAPALPHVCGAMVCPMALIKATRGLHMCSR